MREPIQKHIIIEEIKTISAKITLKNTKNIYYKISGKSKQNTKLIIHTKKEK